MATESVEFDIKANVDDAIKSVKSLEATAEKSVANIADVFGKLKVVAAAALAFVAGREVFQFFEESIELAAKSDAQFAKLEASLKSLGEFTPELVERFGEFADQVEETSKFSDDAVIGLLSLAKQMGRTDDQAEKLVQTAADLASVTGDSLENSFNDLANSLLGNGKALSKTIPEVKSFTAEQLKSGEAIDLIADRLKGASKNAIQTFQGALAQLNNASEDFRKEIGKIITQNPVVIEAIKASTTGFKSLVTLVEDNSDALKSYVGEVIKLAANTLPLLTDALAFTIRSFEGIGLGIGLTRVAFNDLQLAINDIGQTISDVITDGIDFFIRGLGDTVESIGKFISSLGDIPGAEVVFEGLGVNIKEMGDSILDTSKNLKDFKTDITVFDDARDEILKARDESVAFGDTVEATFGATADGVEKFGNIVRDTANKISKADSDVSAQAKKSRAEQEKADQAAIKASVDLARQRAKALDDEKAHGADRKKLAEDAKKFAEDLADKEISESDKVRRQLEKNLDKIKGFESQKAISTEEAQELRVIAHANAERQIQGINDKALQDFEGFQDRVLAKESSNLEKIVLERERNLEKLKAFQASGVADAQKAENLRVAIIKDAEEKTFKARSEANEKYAGVVSNFVNNGLQGLAASAVSLAVDTIAPGFGAAAGQIFQLLAQDTEQFKQTLDQLFSVDFINNISKNLTLLIKEFPTIITNLIENLAENADEIIEPLIAAIIASGPKITIAFIKAINNPKFIEAIVLAVANGIANGLKDLGGQLSTAFKKAVKDIGDEFSKLGGKIGSGLKGALPNLAEFFKDLGADIAEGLKDAITNVGSGAKNVGTGIVNGIKKVFSGIGFAEGGIVPKGFPNDTFPARLTSGELILPPDTVGDLQRFLASNAASGGSSGDAGVQVALLNKIANLLSQPQQVQTTAEVDGRTLANIMLNLSRSNARLAV